MKRMILWAALVGTGSVVGGLLSPLLLPSAPVALAQPSPLPAAPDAVPPNLAFDATIRQVGPSVVTVDASKPANAAQQVKSSELSGSGAIVRLPGRGGLFVVTNGHVVGGAQIAQITVTLSDGGIVRPEQSWIDAESDIAVLKLPAAADLPALTLADSDRVRVGQWVLAFGSPFGLHQTVTHGIISARNRGQISLGSTIRIKEFLQTDAPINPGNSGGPLVDLAGNLVGINTAIATNNGGNSGISFSIPANLLKRVAKELLEKGVVTRGYLGMQLAPTLEPMTALKLGLTSVRGAMIDAVHPGGPASRAGLVPGDVVLKLDGIEVRDENHLINVVSALPVSQRIRLTVWRRGEAKAVDVVVGDWTQAVGRR